MRKSIFLLRNIWIRGREMDPHFCIALLFLVLCSALQVRCFVGWFHTTTLCLELQHVTTSLQKAHNQRKPLPVWDKQFRKESAAASPLHLRAETSAGTRSLCLCWKQDNFNCEGQSHLRHLELYPLFFYWCNNIIFAYKGEDSVITVFTSFYQSSSCFESTAHFLDCVEEE